MKNALFAMLVFFTLTASSQISKKNDWNADIDFIKMELPKNHCNFYSVRDETEFHEGLDWIAKQQTRFSDFEIATKLQQLIASFGDSHTALFWQNMVDKSKVLPLQVMWFSEGIYVVATTKENADILGGKLLKVNDVPLNTVVDSLSTLFSVDNTATIKKTFPNLLPCFQLLEHFFNIHPDSIFLQVEKHDGIVQNAKIRLSGFDKNNAVLLERDAVPLYYQGKKAFFTDVRMNGDSIYYIQYNKCASRERPPVGFRGNPALLPSFNEFKEKVVETIRSNDFKKVIFDMRFNNGGASGMGTELITQLSSLEQINKEGKLYVIIGKETFSSAIINTLDFKKMTKAILVGEETSGMPNHFGNLKFLKLPGSGLMLSFSTDYFKLADENMKTITPDYIVETSFLDFKQGRDPVFEWIRKQKVVDE